MEFTWVAMVMLGLLALFYFFSSLEKEDKLYFMITVMGIFSFYVLTSVLVYEVESAYPIIIIVLVLAGHFISKRFKKQYKDRLEIKAIQDTYWGIDPKRILENNEHKIVQKRGRKEIDEKYLNEVKIFYHINEKKNGEKILNTEVFYLIRDFMPDKQLTKIESLEYFKKDASEMIKKIYDKCVEFDLTAEHELDFEELLEKNGYYLEYFILDIWRKTALYEPIGVAGLDQIAKNKLEIKLVGAMDASISSFVVYDGIELLAHFLFHHEELKLEQKGR
jgi:hypothetical protein